MDSKILLGKFCIVALIILLGCTKSEVGPSGLTSLVKITQEAAGANCANGGFKIETGIDTNKNSTLDTDEIQSTAYICNGANGASGTTGTNGTDGLTSLIKVTAEAAGANCSSGGYRIDTGIDDNADGILETSEIDNTIYVCNGSNGNLVNTNTLPFGVGYKTLVTGTAQDGTTFSDSVNYYYAAGYDYFQLNGNATILSLLRYQILLSGANDNYIDLNLDISNFGATNQTVSLSLNTNYLPAFALPLTGDKLLIFNVTSPTSSTISNYNTSNGLLTFDFTLNWDGASNSTGNPLTLTGSFSGYVYVQVD